ncbi:MAG: PAS domain-containing sensor histidine kinase [Desulfosalsimonas sp.]
MAPQAGGNNTDNLRQAAEKKIESQPDAFKETASLSEDDLRHLIHELQVHKAELQMQNENLHQTQSELETLQQRYRELFENAPVGYISVDPDGIVHTANQTALNLLAISRKNLISRSFSRYVSGEDRIRYLEFFRQFSARKPHGWMEVQLVRTDGSRFYCRLEGHELGNRQQGPPEILLCLSDISEKKEAENELSKTRDQLRKLASHLQTVREEERTSMARELHDEMGQVLAYLKMSLPVIEARIPETDSETRKRINTMKQSLAETIQSTKNLISALRPYQLDELGLIPALESYTREFEEQSGIKTHFFANETELEFSREKETAAYRIVREALSNVARHSGASYVVVNITRKRKKVVVEISDDGTGFAKLADNEETSYGIMGMRERALAVGGDLEIDSETSRGTRLTAWLPE